MFVACQGNKSYCVALTISQELLSSECENFLGCCVESRGPGPSWPWKLPGMKPPKPGPPWPWLWEWPPPCPWQLSPMWPWEWHCKTLQYRLFLTDFKVNTKCKWFVIINQSVNWQKLMGSANFVVTFHISSSSSCCNSNKCMAGHVIATWQCPWGKDLLHVK